MHRTELDDLVVISWKLSELGSERFEKYTKEITYPNDYINDSFYLLKTCERIIIAFLCSSMNHLPNVSHCTVCSSNKNCIGKDLLNKSESLVTNSKTYTGIQAFRYLTLVASSLDSSTIGEHEILGQFKKAFVNQSENKTLFGSLYEIIVFAYKGGKKVHNSSDVPKGRISILSNAEKIFTDWIKTSKNLNDKNVSIAIIGTGKMGKDAYKYFKNKFLNVKVFSRNRLEFSSQELNVIYESYDIFQKEVSNDVFDVLILCSSTNEPFICKDIVKPSSNLLIFDLGVPKNADPDIKEIQGITLFQMDQLVHISEQNYSKREQSLDKAYQIIDDQVLHVTQVFEKRMINPYIKDLRLDLENVAKKRLENYSTNKELPNEFYKWFNNTIKEMMHVSQTHLEKGINESKVEGSTAEFMMNDFPIVSQLKSSSNVNNENN